jgi:hypothetical protein
MSDLRQHLEATLREYSAAHYPGDLAADVLRTPASRSIRGNHRSRWFFSIAGTALAAAAAILIVARMQQVDSVITEPASPMSVKVALTFTPELPALSVVQESETIELAPTGPDLSFSAPTFAVPSFTFLEDQQQQDQEQQKTQEQKTERITQTQEVA